MQGCRFAKLIGYDGDMLPFIFLVPFAWMIAALIPRAVLKSNRNVGLWTAIFALAMVWFAGAMIDLAIMNRATRGNTPESDWAGMGVMFHDLPIWVVLLSPSIPALISVASCYPQKKSEK
jgi:ABC-type methionine transport system permease subunit